MTERLQYDVEVLHETSADIAALAHQLRSQTAEVESRYADAMDAVAQPDLRDALGDLLARTRPAHEGMDHLLTGLGRQVAVSGASYRRTDDDLGAAAS